MNEWIVLDLEDEYFFGLKVILGVLYVEVMVCIKL